MTEIPTHLRLACEHDVPCEPGQAIYNYYDMERGTIGKIDRSPQPDTMKGQDSDTPMAEWSNYWFDFLVDGGGRTSLDGSRVCCISCAEKKGWTE